MRKFIPYLYITFAIIILLDALGNFFQEKEIYRIIFNWNTESKYMYLIVKILFAAVFAFWGIQRLKQSKEQN